MRDNPSVNKRFRLAMYIAPACFGLMIGVQHYIRESFVIYLKYQGLVDSYYHNKQAKKE